MVFQLPEELLIAILSQALHIPDDLLNDTSPTSPFINVEFSTSSVLLVCKSWTRIGTYLLYETVILRTRPQALSLCNTFKQNPSFSSNVKRLRLEGLCAEVLGDARVKLAQLKQLCLALNYTGTREFSGLLEFMRGAEFNLHTIAVADIVGLNPDQASDFHILVRETLPSWDHLRTIVLPLYPLEIHGDTTPCLDALVDAATFCGTLRQLHLPTSGPLEACTSTSLYPGPWHVLHSVPRCRFTITSPATSVAQFRTFSELVPAVLRARVFVETPEYLKSCHVDAATEAATQAAVDVSGGFWHNPLNDAANEVQTAIWKHIVEFAISTESTFYLLPHRRFRPKYWFDLNQVHIPTAKAILFTNRRLSNLVICILARHLHFQLESTAAQFLDIIRSRASVASAISSAAVGQCPPAALHILHRATNLQSIAEWITQTAIDVARIFNAIRRSGAFRGLKRVDFWAANSHALALASRRTHPPLASTDFTAGLSIDGGIFLDGLDSLEYLNWRRHDIPFISLPSNGALDNVTTICTENGCSAFLKWLALCSLASLRELCVSGEPERMQTSPIDTFALTSFLLSHGSKIAELILENCSLSAAQFALCTNVRTLKLREECEPELLDNPVPAPSVKVIYIETYETWDRVGAEASAVWKRLQTALDAGAFTSLEVLHFTGINGQSFLWPTSDLALEQNLWQVIAAEKLKARGVTARDSHGRAYRTRLGQSDMIRRFSSVAERRS